MGRAGKKTFSQAGQAAKGVASKAGFGKKPGRNGVNGGGTSDGRRPSYNTSGESPRYNPPRTDSRGVKVTRRPDTTPPTARKTGTTYEAPEPTPLKASRKKPLGKDKTT